MWMIQRLSMLLLVVNFCKVTTTLLVVQWVKKVVLLLLMPPRITRDHSQHQWVATASNHSLLNSNNNNNKLPRIQEQDSNSSSRSRFKRLACKLRISRGREAYLGRHWIHSEGTLRRRMPERSSSRRTSRLWRVNSRGTRISRTTSTNQRSNSTYSCKVVHRVVIILVVPKQLVASDNENKQFILTPNKNNK